MASISLLRALPHTPVTPAIEPVPAITGVTHSGNANHPAADDRQPVAARDQAQLSAAGTVLARALHLSDVRLDKVAALQQAIANGTYSVSSEALAGWLIESLAA